MKKLLLGAFFSILLLFFAPSLSNAQTSRSYHYNFITVNIKINQDSTFDVEETQSFNFKGNYHQGQRSIPFRKIDAVSDISITDTLTGKSLIRSSSKLNKEDPDSWGKFADYQRQGKQIIEWYYNLEDTTYTWTLKYKIHGGIEFNKAYDRLYWNIFTDYDVPIDQVEVFVNLPGDFDIQKSQVYSYRSIRRLIEQKIINLDHSVSFTSSDFAPREAFTIDIAWPKGYVSQSAYWMDFVKIYYGYIFGVIIFLVCLTVGFIFWLSSEKLKKGKGTIVPQYEPPEDLKPAVAEVITKERLTNKGLSATIIDLAVRGFIKIEEQPKSTLEKILSFAGGIIVTIILVIIVAVLIATTTYYFKELKGIGFILYVIIFPLVLLTIYRLIGSKILTIFKNYPDYKVTKMRSLEGKDIEDYEIKYLKILFQGKDYFETKKLKKSTSRELYESIARLKDDIYRQTNIKTRAYDVDLIAEKKKTTILSLLLMGAIIAFYIGGLYVGSNSKQPFILLVTSFMSVAGLYAFIKYEARLNESGRILKEEWLGFKMYLEKAEKYRLQNLTPELFEKYLPYAMVFGIEKKWAKAFDGINMPAPSWYTGGYYTGSGGFNSSGSSFSPSSFSASFASSFSSSFGGSGAGGGGAGGGGAGGGGGGGGGGAS